MRQRVDAHQVATGGYLRVPEVQLTCGIQPDCVSGIRQDGPVVYRAAAAQWPSVQGWSFAQLAQRAPATRVQVVHGDRETGCTVLDQATLQAYLLSLEHATPAKPAGYLKEFDLLAAIPELALQAPLRDMLPARGLASIRSWIGPRGSRTGLHRDLLDNMLVQVLGRKRWRFVRPGVVERLGHVSRKYDAWAVLASCDAESLRPQDARHDFLYADLHPGDLITVPAGWWHEVENMDASLAVAAFHGPTVPVLAQWLVVQARQALHRLGWQRSDGCTCHSDHAVKCTRSSGSPNLRNPHGADHMGAPD